jgi:hypothetical protein
MVILLQEVSLELLVEFPVVNGSGVAGNPTLDLINTTTVVPATYNTPTIAWGYSNT